MILGCECNRYGSTRTDCEQSTGQCQCRHGMTGLKCDKCTNGLQIGINGCDICMYSFILDTMQRYKNH